VKNRYVLKITGLLIGLSILLILGYQNFFSGKYYLNKALNISEKYTSFEVIYSFMMNILKDVNENSKKENILYVLGRLNPYMFQLDELNSSKKDTYRAILCNSYRVLEKEKEIDLQIKSFLKDHPEDIYSEGVFEKFLYCIMQKKSKPSDEIKDILIKDDIGKIFYDIYFSEKADLVMDRKYFERVRNIALNNNMQYKDIKKIYDYFDEKEDIRIYNMNKEKKIDVSYFLKKIDLADISLKEKTGYIYEYFLDNNEEIDVDKKRVLLERFRKLDQIGDPLMKIERKVSLAILEFKTGEKDKSNQIIKSILDLQKESELDFEVKYMNYLLSKYYLNISELGNALKYALVAGDGFREHLIVKIAGQMAMKKSFKKAQSIIEEYLMSDMNKINAYIKLQRAKDIL